MGIKYGNCAKCLSRWQNLREFNGQWLGVECLCYQEEVDKATSNIEQDLQDLDTYKQLVAGTKNVGISSY